MPLLPIFTEDTEAPWWHVLSLEADLWQQPINASLERRRLCEEERAWRHASRDEFETWMRRRQIWLAWPSDEESTVLNAMVQDMAKRRQQWRFVMRRSGYGTLSDVEASVAECWHENARRYCTEEKYCLCIMNLPLFDLDAEDHEFIRRRCLQDVGQQAHDEACHEQALGREFVAYFTPLGRNFGVDAVYLETLADNDLVLQARLAALFSIDIAEFDVELVRAGPPLIGFSNMHLLQY